MKALHRVALAAMAKCVSNEVEYVTDHINLSVETEKSMLLGAAIDAEELAEILRKYAENPYPSAKAGE